MIELDGGGGESQLAQVSEHAERKSGTIFHVHYPALYSGFLVQSATTWTIADIGRREEVNVHLCDDWEVASWSANESGRIRGGRDMVHPAPIIFDSRPVFH